jgi:serine protease AprX
MASLPPKSPGEYKSIQETLVDSRLSQELLAAIDAKRLEKPKPKRATRKGAKQVAVTVPMPAPAPDLFDVIIEFNRSFPGGIAAARVTLLRAYQKACERGGKPLAPSDVDQIDALAVSSQKVTVDDTALIDAFDTTDALLISKSLWTDNYLFGALSLQTIIRISSFTIDLPVAPTTSGNESGPSKKETVLLVYKVWLDQQIKRCVYESRRTIKCDAALASFASDGKGIVWAVADTGIDEKHPHFQTLDTLVLPDGLTHMDFTDSGSPAGALIDADGHGTHVAGIIAGMTCRANDVPPLVVTDKVRQKISGLGVDQIKITVEKLGADNRTIKDDVTRDAPIYGIAPFCKILSLKVLKAHDDGNLSSLLSAIGYVRKVNDYGRSVRIHGLNLSLGYDFNAQWFAAGQSPLCNEVNLLVRSGVCVVVAAGNGGYGSVANERGIDERATHLGTISDPGNAALAITVGSTHRDMPHAYGISYFSAKGPTADGRMKPDLVAPGERIVSCDRFDPANKNVAPYKVDSGTSMAAPHVSGAVAAFISSRNEFIARPEEVKEILVQAATDLKRRSEFQGGGLLDLMRALQSV